MNWDAIGAVGEVLGALGVIVTLIYLARQIRHNSQQVRGASTIAVHQFQRSMVEQLLAQPDLFKLVTKANISWQALTFDEQGLVALWLLKETGFHEMCFQLWKQGALEESVYQSRITYFVSLMSNPGKRTWWDEQASAFMLDPLFYEEVTRKLDDYRGTGEDFAQQFPQFKGVEDTE